MSLLRTHQQPEQEMPPTPQVSLKERQRQERENLILQAAMDLLVEKGYHEMSMEELAARVGISKGAVYLHFTSKDELISELVERGVRSFLRVLEETLSVSGTPREKLGRVVEQLYGNVAGKRFQVMAAVSQSPELSRLLAAKHNTLATLWEEPSRRIAAEIDEGKRVGEFDATLPTSLVLSLLWSLLTLHGFQNLVIRDGMPVEELAGHLGHFFLKGIAAGGPPTMGGEER